jgi:pyridoxine kinase
MQKKVLAINDISCVGRCSLTVALPIISSCGIECSIMPTAILSTHTGGFSGYTFTDFTNQMLDIANHWKSLNLNFDSIYTGFLGSKEQIDIVKQIVNMFKNRDTKVIVDPAMADNGSMYSIFDLEFASEMKKLCIGADVIVPNITEACFLTGVKYQQAPHSKEFIDTLIFELGKLDIKSLVLTGVSYEESSLGSLTYDYLTNTYNYYKREIIPEYFHGTGDCFASALTAAITKGKSTIEASRIAVDFTVNSILETIKYPNIDKKYGVNFEEALESLICEMKK